MKTCKSCKEESAELYAPFDSGAAIYCTQCQMDAETDEMDSADDYGDSYDVFGY